MTIVIIFLLLSGCLLYTMLKPPRAEKALDSEIPAAQSAEVPAVFVSALKQNEAKTNV